MFLGLFGPALLPGRLLAPSFPDVALVIDEATGRWAIDDAGDLEPDGYMIFDGTNYGADDSVSSGLPIGFEATHPYAEVS